jgi:DHA1 family tetracycline resistance protein-like MFS transporter
VYSLVTGLCQLFACPIMGAVSDRFGRRPAMLGIALSAAATTAALGLGLSLNTLVVVSAATSFGGGQFAMTGVGFAAVADITAGMPPASRVRYMGVVEAVLWVGLLVGPTLGGHLNSLIGAPAVFFFLALPNACLPLLIFSLRESHNAKRSKFFDWRAGNVVGTLAMLGTAPGTMLLSAMVVCANMGTSGFIAVTPLYAQRVFGWSAEETVRVIEGSFERHHFL